MASTKTDGLGGWEGWKTRRVGRVPSGEYELIKKKRREALFKNICVHVALVNYGGRDVKQTDDSLSEV